MELKTKLVYSNFYEAENLKNIDFKDIIVNSYEDIEYDDDDEEINCISISIENKLNSGDMALISLDFKEAYVFAKNIISIIESNKL